MSSFHINVGCWATKLFSIGILILILTRVSDNNENILKFINSYGGTKLLQTNYIDGKIGILQNLSSKLYYTVIIGIYSQFSVALKLEALS